MQTRPLPVILFYMQTLRSSLARVRAPGYRWVVVAALVASLTALLVGGRGDAATSYDAEEKQFLQLINEYRKGNGLRPLILSDTLSSSSERHSKDMAEYGFFAHNTERSSYYPAGSEPWDRMEADGYRYNTAKGENLAVGYESAEEAMRAWQESASHNAAMLDGNYRVIGIARINAPGSVHGWYWTTDFGGVVDPTAHAPGKKGPDAPEQQPAKEPAKEPAASTGRPGETGRRTVADTGALENGSMQSQVVWRDTARDGADLILDEGNARLGGYHDGLDEMRQKVRIGRDARLAFDLRIRASENATSADRLLVRLTDGGGRQIAVLERYTGREAEGWHRERVDLSRFANRTVFLSFHVKTDADRLTTFYLDDVRMAR